MTLHIDIKLKDHIKQIKSLKGHYTLNKGSRTICVIIPILLEKEGVTSLHQKETLIVSTKQSVGFETTP